MSKRNKSEGDRNDRRIEKSKSGDGKRKRFSRKSPFLITTEAADYLQLKKRTLENMRWRGQGPKFRKHGGRVCYHVDDLDTWSRSSHV
ncbi:MAG: helix-turn-helix domain-containing protein [Marinicaulis sp.]|nr:helix-turn-helix domain-containing protein [Marinicaulis sp.]NNL87606.1 helix-turn-helix domain-containing protein [Marinicaulis sp.]